MYCILQLLLLSFLLHGTEGSDSQCDDSIVKHKKPTKIDTTNKYGLWPGLVNDEDLVNGEQLFGTEEALELIWKNQNPPDCSKAKYLVSTGWYQGFGSEVHYHGVVLGLALDTGRVLIQEGGWTWRYRNEHCKTQGLKNMECYMLPLSKCTIHDAMATMLPEHKNFHKNSHHHESHDAARDEPNDHHPENKTHLINNPVTEWTAEEDKLLMDGVFNHGKKGHWSVIAMSLPQKTDVQCHDRWKSHTEPSIRKRRSNPSYIEKILNEDDPTIVDYFTHHKVVAVNRVKEAVVNEGKPIDLVIKHKDTIDDYVIMVHEDLILKYHDYTPRLMAPIWKCAGLNKGNEYMWWRAISASYMLRPSKETLALIETHRDAEVKKANGHCVSAYIRHGDKGVEMQLVPFTKYASAALTIFNNASNADVAPLAGGDGKKVMFVATEDPAVIGQAQSWGNSNKIDVRITELNRKILSDKRSSVKPHDLERSLPAHREYEYVSYLVHLADNVKCAANICTIPSNFCRLIDELRGTVGGKANKLMVDLSSETCPNSPCFRYTGFANHPGAVYDPKTRIWRY